MYISHTCSCFVAYILHVLYCTRKNYKKGKVSGESTHTTFFGVRARKREMFEVFTLRGKCNMNDVFTQSSQGQARAHEEVEAGRRSLSRTGEGGKVWLGMRLVGSHYTSIPVRWYTRYMKAFYQKEKSCYDNNKEVYRLPVVCCAMSYHHHTVRCQPWH